MTGDEDLRKSIDQLRLTMESLIEKMVRRDVYDSDQRGVSAAMKVIADDVDKIDTRLDKQDEQRQADRRLLIAAFVSPVVLLVIQLYLRAQGIS